MSRMPAVPALTFVVALFVTACVASPNPPAGASSSPAASLGPDPTDSRAPARTPLTSDPLHTVELFDVNTQTTFTLGALAADRPVLLETMAIWCPNCREQQYEVVAAHDLAEFESVSLDIDPNERPGDLATYAAENGFDWRFATANQTVASLLRDRFGAAVLNPPSTPIILLFPDGSVRALEFGRVYSSADLAAEIAAG